MLVPLVLVGLQWSTGGGALAARPALEPGRLVHVFAARRYSADVADGFSDPVGGVDPACRVCHASGAGFVVARSSAGPARTQASDWRMYGSDPDMLAWIDGRVEPAPTGSSKLCLGCHDGLFAPNQYADGGGASQYSSIPPAIGSTGAGLTNNHPISITYAWGRDARLRDPDRTLMADGRPIASLLENGRVECATCHDPHGIDSVPGTPLLRMATAGDDVTGQGASGLCLVCHDQ